MRVLHLSTYAGSTGAGRAAYSLHQALRGAGVDSQMLVASSAVREPGITELGGRSQVRWRLAQRADRALWNLQRSANSSWRSPAYFGASLREHIDRVDPDVINLHWVTNGFLTVEDIGRLGRPVVWSMYDMWPFSGAEHYGSLTTRIRDGYNPGNRPAGDAGVDLDRWTWQRKKQHWRVPMHMVAASRWLEELTHESALLRDWPVSRIPHAVDDSVFVPGDAQAARTYWGLDSDKPTIAFLASAGLGDHRKGGDVLLQALHIMRTAGEDFQTLIAGPKTSDVPRGVGDVRWVESLRSDTELCAFYQAASAVAVPSREDTMPLVALEAQMCGVPVVASDVGGLPDAVDDQVSGALVPAGDPDALAKALAGVVHRGSAEQPRQTRDRAYSLWSFAAVGKQYEQLYLTAMSE